MDILTNDARALAGSTAEMDRLGHEIAKLSAHLDAAVARLLDLIREFDAREGWNNGFRSCAHWLSWRVGLDMGAAREKVRVARALGTLPRLAQALARGELSYAKVRALTRVATPETEERLLAVARAGTAEHVERIVRGWRRVDRYAEARESAARHRSRTLRVYRDDDGMVVVRGRLEPEVGELLAQALNAAREVLYQRTHRTFNDARCGDVSTEPPALEQQQADALALLAETALHHGIDPRGAGQPLPGGGPRRRAGARRCRGARPVGARERRTRSRGNVSAPGLRRQPRGDAARSRRSRGRGLRPDPHDPSGITSRAPSPRPRLSLSWLRSPLRPGTSHPSLGTRRPDDALKPRHALSSSPSRRSRGGVRGRSAA